MNLNNLIREIDEDQTKKENLETSKKKINSITIATKINEMKVMKIDACKFKDNIFDDASIIVDCTLNHKNENQYQIKIMIDNDCIEYFFIDINIAHKICESLNINLLKLNKSRKVKKYDEKKNKDITHVIYSFMMIQNHTKNSTSIMIIKFD